MMIQVMGMVIICSRQRKEAVVQDENTPQDRYGSRNTSTQSLLGFPSNRTTPGNEQLGPRNNPASIVTNDLASPDRARTP